MRYSEIRKEMYNITDAVLASTLKDMIADGIVDRKSYDEIPPRVEYSLTDKGRSAVPFLQGLCNWSSSYNSGNPEYQMTHCSYCKFNKKL